MEFDKVEELINCSSSLYGQYITRNLNAKIMRFLTNGTGNLPLSITLGKKRGMAVTATSV